MRIHGCFDGRLPGGGNGEESNFSCSVMENRNRLQFCLCCGGRLDSDKNVITSEERYAYRTRVCMECGARHHTKQPPESFCGFELQ